ncbi:MAG TPA: hypothetical protein VHK70_08330 [Burkholderiaceae bacterium]|nr:hypothetical protein [Burkholderiaceae bacterium]
MAKRVFINNAAIFLSREQADKVGVDLAYISAVSARMGSIIGQIKGGCAQEP